VRLERDAREAGDLGEVALELGEDLLVALRLLARREGVEPVERGPRDRDHLARGVQLHRARAERDHAVREREVAALELLYVAEHRGLGVVAPEDRVLEVLARAALSGRDRARDRRLRRSGRLRVE